MKAGVISGFTVPPPRYTPVCARNVGSDIAMHMMFVRKCSCSRARGKITVLVLVSQVVHELQEGREINALRGLEEAGRGGGSGGSAGSLGLAQ